MRKPDVDPTKPYKFVERTVHHYLGSSESDKQDSFYDSRIAGQPSKPLMDAFKYAVQLRYNASVSFWEKTIKEK